jgi:hypothetical protein
MPSLLEILKDPNYVNANPATKAAIFDKYSVQDLNYAEANDATKAAIRARFGIGGASASEAIPEPISGPRVNPEELGVGERLAAAGKRGVESFGEMLGGLGLAKETLTGDTEAARARMQGIQEQKRLEEREGSKTLSAADIGRIYEKEGLLSAAGKIPSYIG